MSHRSSMPSHDTPDVGGSPRRKAALFSTPETLREALYPLVHHSPLSVEQQADQLGLSPSYIYNAANPNLDNDGFHYQLRHLVPHTKLTGNTVVVDFIERQLGRVAVPVQDSIAPLSPDHARMDLLAITKELGDVASVMQASLADDALTAAEGRKVRKELWDLITEAVKLHEALRPLSKG